MALKDRQERGGQHRRISGQHHRNLHCTSESALINPVFFQGYYGFNPSSLDCTSEREQQAEWIFPSGAFQSFFSGLYF